ncbi:uncharacterized protein Z519_01688 [Cladophialophora bantiana CBS 173.52]|uniref:DUF6593 domain-containing protein n=1 Tax=Cladophialophora bantiana (strain ATCC 10958 / CBS 173.52 / CDC B-1940 / NIH 8579) TaxID=1442370 RepID=A0A0D2IMV7_CLAB1|nr:uncharacterized protein Z519_01688 [Cladophialophora bantiana CBS 173.52]KIW98104.1 hypothetical protein Z519_01688 [Cladophialophora bantiana CBS 173.52]
MKNPFKRHQETEAVGSDLTQDEDDQWASFQPQQPFQFNGTDLGSESRTLHVQYQDYWNHHTTIRVLDTDPTTVIYTVDARYRKPQMTIRSNSNDGEVATVDFHCLTTRIDMRLHGRTLSLESSGFMKTQYSYASPELGGEKMTWTPRKKLDDLNMVLLNGQGLAIARYKPNYKGPKRGGSMEMLAPCLTSGAMMEEVIVMCLAVSHYKESQRIAAAITAAT